MRELIVLQRLLLRYQKTRTVLYLFKKNTMLLKSFNRATLRLVTTRNNDNSMDLLQVLCRQHDVVSSQKPLQSIEQRAKWSDNLISDLIAKLIPIPTHNVEDIGTNSGVDEGITAMLLMKVTICFLEMKKIGKSYIKFLYNKILRHVWHLLVSLR